MVDNRPLSSRIAGNYWTSSAALNNHYAQNYGYDFVYFQPTALAAGSGEFKTRMTCSLDRTTRRGAPWCKLPVIAYVLTLGYETVVFLDSDGYFKSDAQAVAISGLVPRFKGGKIPPSPHEQRSKAWFPSNAPWTKERPNSGLILCSPSPSIMELIRRWWWSDVNPGPGPFFEQDALWSLMDHPAYGSRVGLMRELKWLAMREWEHMPAIHVASSPAFRRQLASMQAQELAKASVRVSKIRTQSVDASSLAVTLLERARTTEFDRVLFTYQGVHFVQAFVSPLLRANGTAALLVMLTLDDAPVDIPKGAWCSFVGTPGAAAFQSALSYRRTDDQILKDISTAKRAPTVDVAPLHLGCNVPLDLVAVSGNAVQATIEAPNEREVNVTATTWPWHERHRTVTSGASIGTCYIRLNKTLLPGEALV
eukprot:CAMPEP_0119514136 /NCGR_PEP_ID=MMETSP1344-20130328/32032_1 /TAXON_ID=236787 /ORGANISM="Florenciella parvula, Strain CCMP2471" /LENGTH=422 /DNA_ID=CAMNT_0007551419 /DNA_START=51 /DNA_END=1316 /DNA_ORIENTATION=-